MAKIEIMPEGVSMPESASIGSRISSEVNPVVAKVESTTISRSLTSPVSTEKVNKSWQAQPEYDPNREDYITKVEMVNGKEGRYNLIVDPKTGKEVARMARIAGGAPLPAEELPDFNPDVYSDPKLKRIANQLQNIAKAGNADENVFSEMSRRIGVLIDTDDEGKINEAEVQDILNRLAAWRIKATESTITERAVAPETVRQPSVFEQTLFNIAGLKADLETSPGSQDLKDRLEQEKNNLNELLKQANEAGLFQTEKPGLYDLLRMGRIDLSIRDRRDGAKLRHISDTKARAEQTSVETEAFWNDPRYPQRRQLRIIFGGSVDYFNRGSGTLINSVVKNPSLNEYVDILADRDYSDVREDYIGVEGIIAAWNYEWINGKGEVESAGNFEEIRKKTEQERQERPRFMKHHWYHSVEFFADNMHELGLATKDFVRHAIANLPRGESKVMLNNLQQEQAAAQSAYADAILFFERKAEDPEVKWISSEMNSAFSMAGIGFFQRLGGKGVEGFQYFANSWAEGLRKTDTSINYEDALTLDEDGMFLYIAERLCENNGEIYRFGSNSTKFPSEEKMFAYLAKKRAEIIKDAARYRLKSIGDPNDPNYLLKPYDAVSPDNPITLTDENNPLYKLLMQLKAKADEMDAEDVRNGHTITISRWEMYVDQNKGSIPLHRAFAQAKIKCDLADAEDVLQGEAIAENRWEIFKREAAAWEDFARRGKTDTRDLRAKVKFIHPLARILNDEEFQDMYEQIPEAEAEKREEKAAYLIKRVDDYLRFNMIDVRSGSARIYIYKEGEEKPVRVEAYTNLLRNELKRAMAMDKDRDFLDKRFKMSHILRAAGYDPAMPAYSLFAIGADDTLRNEAILRRFEEEPDFVNLLKEIKKSKEASQKEIDDHKALLKAGGMSEQDINNDPELNKMLKLKNLVNTRNFRGSNAKTIIVKFVEDERLAVQAVQRAIRLSSRIDIRDESGVKTGEYFNGTAYDNFPGYDLPFEEGGTKFWKNLLYPDYGTSRGTVRVDGMIPFMNYGVLDRISELGGWSPKYITGLRHRGDEVELAKEGTLLIDPKDTQDYLSRFESMVKKRALWTAAGDSEKKPGAMMGGFFSGMYHLRELGTHSEFFSQDFKEKGRALIGVIERPEDALSQKYLTETGKKAFLDTTARIVAPLEAIMMANRELETAYGYAQGTAKNMNTLLVQDIGYWMDNYWEEYMGDFGYAIDGMLHLGRSYMYVYLKEAGLIWPEKKTKKIEGWDDISKRLVKDLPEDLQQGVPLGSFMYPDEGSIKVTEDSPYIKAPTRDKKKERVEMLKNL